MYQKIKLLDDLPSERDEFGSHQRIAEAIFEVIRQEEGGKSIAIIGEWGSGKSTIIEILKHHISKFINNKTIQPELFVFNAWAHQGDPLRRSFLESLIEYFTSNKLTTKNKWEKDLEGISRRREDTETISQPILSLSGKLLIISLFFVPLGNILLNISNSYQNSSVLGLPIWLVGLILTILPLFTILITWAYWRPNIKFWGKIFWKEYRNKDREENLIGLFFSKNKEVVISKIFRTPDPTSIEFNDIFIRLVEEIICNSNKKLIIVIDNLDRIDPKEALSIWATMRTFFEFDNLKYKKYANKFWLIVPFDLNSIKKLWNNEKNNDLALSFIDKSFQIKFYVPSLILSDYKKYLIDQLKIALPEEQSEDTIHLIYRIYELKGRPKTCPPTPRDIKQFINRLISLYLHWGKIIPLHILALYVVYEKEIENNGFDLTIIKKDMDYRIKDLLEEQEWEKYITAIYYGVEPNKAIQILIETPIVLAFSSGDITQVDSYLGIPSFSDVCEQVIEKYYDTWLTDGLFPRVSFFLNEIEQKSIIFKGTVWNRIIRGISEGEILKILDQKSEKGINIIIDKCPENKLEILISKIFEKLSKLPWGNQQVTFPDQEEKVKNWISIIEPFIESVEKKGMEKLISEQFSLPGEPTIYFQAIKYLLDENIVNSLIKYFKPSTEPEKITSELVKLCNEGKLQEFHSNIIFAMHKMNIHWNWQPFISVLKNRLNALNSSNREELNGCIKSLIYLSYVYNNSEAISYLNELSTNGKLFHFLNQKYNIKEFDSVSICLLPLLYSMPFTSLQLQYPNSQQGYDTFKSILKNPDEGAEIVDNLTKLILEINKSILLIDQYAKAQEIRILILKVLEKIVQSKESEKDLITNEINNLEFKKDFSELYVLGLKISPDQIKESFRNHLISKLGSIKKDEWVNILKYEHPILELMIELIKQGDKLNLSSDFYDALNDNSKEIIDGKTKVKRYQEKWNAILLVLDNKSQKTFLRTLRDNIINNCNKDLSHILELYGLSLIDSKVLLEISKADDVVRILFIEILKRRVLMINELKWIENIVAKNPSILEKCQKESLEGLKDRLNTLSKTEGMEDDQDEQKIIIFDILKLISDH